MADPGGQPARAFMSIGEVLAQLRPLHPDITISKIRFLEDEGLVKPERTASGYRKFSREDVGRLRYVLSAQRDHYLPLRVIKEHLHAIDRGAEPPALGRSGAAGGAEESAAAAQPGSSPHAEAAGQQRQRAPAADSLPGPDAFAPEPTELRLSRSELLSAAGLQPDQLDQLEQYGLIGVRPGGNHYDGDALTVARTVAGMARFGIEARHLRAFKAAADREIGLVEQVVIPLARQRGPEARARADETARELAALSVRLHVTLVRAGLAPGLRR